MERDPKTGRVRHRGPHRPPTSGERVEALLDLDRKRELTRLLTLLALWPSAAGRREFKTELHLKRETEEMYERIYG